MTAARLFIAVAAIGATSWRNQPLRACSKVRLQPSFQASQASVVLAAADQSQGMALLSAVVSSAGMLVRTSGAVSAQQLAGLTGQYESRVAMRDVSMCTFTASIGSVGNPSNLPPAGTASVAGRNGNLSAVFVVMRNVGGVVSNLPFHLQVFCAR